MQTSSNTDITTQYLDANSAEPIKQAAALLQAGELIAVPTETVYGLAADASNSTAVRRIFAVKQRPTSHPLIVHIGSLTQLGDWAKDLPQMVYVLAAAFWPGPLTLLLPKNDQVDGIVTGGLATIGIRMPAHPVLLALLEQNNLAIAAPSANLHKQLSPTNAEQVLHSLNGQIAAVLDGGECELGIESTILDLTQSRARILRHGPINAAQIATVLGEPVDVPQQHTVAVSGNLAAHYQPQTPVILLAGKTMLQRLNNTNVNIICLTYSELFQNLTDPRIHRLPANAVAYGKGLYKTLFQLDKFQAEAIWVEQPPETWHAINDRLQRAASKL